MCVIFKDEPDRRSNFFFSPPAHLCAVTYITEISLHVALSNQSHSHSLKDETVDSKQIYLQIIKVEASGFINFCVKSIPNGGPVYPTQLNLVFTSLCRLVQSMTEISLSDYIIQVHIIIVIIKWKQCCEFANAPDVNRNYP